MDLRGRSLLTYLGPGESQPGHKESVKDTARVFESPASVVFDETANRMPTIKALMIATLGPGS